MRRPGRLLLGLVLLGLLACLLVLWLAPGPVGHLRNWQAPPAHVPNLADIETAALEFDPAATENYPGVLARPLLNPSRRPEQAGGAASDGDGPQEEPIPDTLDHVKVRGIINGPTLAGAMIENQEGGTEFVRVGENVGPWRFDGLDGSTASFSYKQERRALELQPLGSEEAGTGGGDAVYVPAQGAAAASGAAGSDVPQPEAEAETDADRKPARRAAPAFGGSRPDAAPSRDSES